MDKIKILVVDDEPDILDLLQYNLKEEGYEVFVASNGEEGLEKAETIKPNLIILDVMMPKMDGIEVCNRLRKKEEFNDTLIAFLTAKDSEHSEVNALDIGADEYITKPIRQKILISRVNALMRRFRTKTIKIGDLIVDKDRISVRKDGNEIELAKKEFELLSLLVSRPGKVFPREEIFNKVWGTDVIVGNRTIDVHIRKLREKIGNEYIKTIKGIGYKFEF